MNFDFYSYYLVTTPNDFFMKIYLIKFPFRKLYFIILALIFDFKYYLIAASIIRAIIYYFPIILLSIFINYFDHLSCYLS
jgi:hypothetical protein